MEGNNSRMDKQATEIPRDSHGYPINREFVNAITFTLNRWGMGTIRIIIVRSNFGAIVTIEKGSYMLFKTHSRFQREISRGKFYTFIERLYMQYDFEKWNEYYRNPEILDGEDWEIRVDLDHHTSDIRKGVNAYPDNWHEVCESFMNLY